MHCWLQAGRKLLWMYETVTETVRSTVKICFTLNSPYSTGQATTVWTKKLVQRIRSMHINAQWFIVFVAWWPQILLYPQERFQFRISSRTFVSHSPSLRFFPYRSIDSLSPLSSRNSSNLDKIASCPTFLTFWLGFVLLVAIEDCRPAKGGNINQATKRS